MSLATTCTSNKAKVFIILRSHVGSPNLRGADLTELVREHNNKTSLQQVTKLLLKNNRSHKNLGRKRSSTLCCHKAKEEEERRIKTPCVNISGDTAGVSSAESAGRALCKLKGFVQIFKGTLTALFQPTSAIRSVCSAQIVQQKETLTSTRTSLSWSKLVNLVFTCNSGL